MNETRNAPHTQDTHTSRKHQKRDGACRLAQKCRIERMAQGTGPPLSRSAATQEDTNARRMCVARRPSKNGTHFSPPRACSAGAAEGFSRAVRKSVRKTAPESMTIRRQRRGERTGCPNKRRTGPSPGFRLRFKTRERATGAVGRWVRDFVKLKRVTCESHAKGNARTTPHRTAPPTPSLR